MAKHYAIEHAVSWPSDAAVKHLLPALEVSPRALLCDVDGTLAALAPTPEEVTLLPGVAQLLTRALTCFDLVAVISGRSAADVRALVGVPGVLYIGNHGFERLEINAARGHMDETLTIVQAAVPYIAAIEAALDILKVRLEPLFPGILFEPKGVTASIHVRLTANPELAASAVYAMARQVARAHGLRVTLGKLVVELRPPVAVDKGVAVAELVAAHGFGSAVYLGDDSTDVDAFRALRQLSNEHICQGISVAVLNNEAPPELSAEADIALASIALVPAFLRWVVEQAEQHPSV